VAARLLWIATHATPANPAAAAIPTVKPTAEPRSTHAAAVSAKPKVVATVTPAAKPTAIAVSVYTGSAVSTQYGPIQVAITVRQSKITAVTVSASPDSTRSQVLEAQAIPTLKSETLQAQSANVNSVSGATEISNAYVESLKSAVSKAGL
jgi:uncharacterized protein with FMN-binding domain